MSEREGKLSNPRARAARAMHGENLWKFMETRARASRALYEFIFPLPIVQYDDCTNVQNGRAKGTCLGSLKTEQAIRCCWVRESASTHPSPHGISSAAGTDPNCFGCEFIKKNAISYPAFVTHPHAAADDGHRDGIRGLPG